MCFFPTNPFSQEVLLSSCGFDVDESRFIIQGCQATGPAGSERPRDRTAEAPVEGADGLQHLWLMGCLSPRMEADPGKWSSGVRTVSVP